MLRRDLFKALAAAPLAWWAEARASATPLTAPARVVDRTNELDEITKRVSHYALQAIRSNLQLGALVNRSFEPTIAQPGDTVNVPLPPRLCCNNICTGDYVPPILGNCQVTLNKHMEATFTLPDVEKALHIGAYLQMHVQPASIALSEAIEGDLLGLTPKFVPVASGSDWQWVLAEVEEALFMSKVPPALPKYVVVDADTYSILRQSPRFSECRSHDLHMGNIRIAGQSELFILRSQLLRPGDRCPAFAEDAMVLVSRRLQPAKPDSGARSAYAESSDFGIRVTSAKATMARAVNFTIDMLYGVGTPRPHFGRQVRFEKG